MSENQFDLPKIVIRNLGRKNETVHIDGQLIIGIQITEVESAVDEAPTIRLQLITHPGYLRMETDDE